MAHLRKRGQKWYVYWREGNRQMEGEKYWAQKEAQRESWRNATIWQCKTS